ncbi:MAG: class I SAM-dependent methyltransferase [Chloroflexota bacterium]
METETTPCPLCGDTGYTPLMPTEDRLCHRPGRFELVQCLGCGLAYLNPRPTPESIGEYYPEGYDPFIEARLEDLPVVQRLSVRYGLARRCRLIAALRQGGRLLDVGCATGQFLAEMSRHAGWEVAGVDPSPLAAAFARDTYRLDVHTGDLHSARFPNGHFDVITMWDVLEHLHAPLDVLAEIRRVLGGNGYLILRTPSLDSLDARLFGQFWAGLDSPRHLTVFSRRTVTQVLERAGFNVQTFRTGTGGYFTYLLSYGFWLDESIRRPKVRRALLAMARNWPVRLLASLPLALADVAGLGSEMVIVARAHIE